MGGLVIPQTVRTQDYSQVAIPGRQQMVGNGGKVIKVNAGGNGYELGDGGAGGGGIIGTAEVWSQNGTIFDNGGAGASFIMFGDVRYNGVFDPYALSPGESSIPNAEWLTKDLHRIVLAPGWYHIVCFVDIGYANPADAPTYWEPYVSGVDAWPGNSGTHIVPTVQYGTRKGITHWINVGTVYMPPDYPGLHLEARRGAATPPAAGTPLPGLKMTNATIAWNITKLT